MMLTMLMMPPAFRKPAAPLAVAIALTIAASLTTAIACGSPATPSATPPPPTQSPPPVVALPTQSPTMVVATPTQSPPPPAATIIATPTNPDQVRVVTVGPYREECVGVAPQMCLVVNDELFYDEIDGFDHQPGYQYRLRIEQYDRWPGQTEIPQDTGRYGYRLLEILDQQRVAGR